ncbi:FBXW7 [Lepeophtheirus salmonis]|uniref:FBXW7 n=1 Tax=Lepeophtheirus salmonis TaxID=72036 RepID=A0A7R8CTS1_LEPSM|nr:FBXW7 [Lepeophtheirus salmonis]CAF2927783.1 FBXW7 [Lepeophtheirus salmonis]
MYENILSLINKNDIMESARIKSEILTRIKNNASKCGLELGLDILSLLAEYSVFHLTASLEEEKMLLRDGNLFTASYDCSICVYTSTKKDDWVLKKTLKGPLGWADALECNGEIMITQDEKTFVLSVWNLCWNENEVSDNCCELLFSLVGHEEEVNCAIIHGNQYILSGSSDKTLRLWSYESGECLHVLTGFKGKVWCADMNNTQIIAGGRFGQIGFWSLEELNEGKGRILDPHSHITAVGSIKLEKLGLLSGDGEGHIF